MTSSIVTPHIGQSKHDLATPRLCLDLDVMERNLASMARFMAEHGKQWRPHAKSHRCPALAQRLVDAGAIGVTCATLDEAEQMIAAGIGDVLLAYPTAGLGKPARLAALCGPGDPIATCDHYAQVGPLAEACRSIGVECRVVVEVDIGMQRVGIRPGTDARDLARAIDGLDGVRLVGLMGYEGHLLTIADPDEKRRRIEEAMGVLVHTRDRLLRDGLACDVVSAGGTGSYHTTATCDGITEIQAGGGIFGDPFYRDVCHVDGLDHALTVVATVVSRPTIDRAVVDAGRKCLNGELCMPSVQGHPDATVSRLSAEHGVLELGPASRDLTIGDRVDVVVAYSDFTNVLHPDIVGIRNGVVETIWPIGGRFRGGRPHPQ